MPRTTSANVCREETQVVVVATGKTAVVACGKAQGHPDQHRKGSVTWPKRAAAPPQGRRV